ncbi:MAG: DUF436 family protein [Clostridia bacterium]|nr:DUF436 family protein [Clostridia bacterium]
MYTSALLGSYTSSVCYADTFLRKARPKGCPQGEGFVAVPVRLSINKIGNASITCARVRPKFIGGIRAIYDENKM